jgi:DNA-binding winged helix-turn-helix (wHTH) protein
MHSQLGASPTAYRFGEFVLDLRAFRLVGDGGRHVVLEPKALDVLAYLAQRPGELVSKQDLIDAVWQGTAVGDNALTRVIAQLRRALKDDAREARYIQTVHARGYRFVAQPTPVATIAGDQAGQLSISSR